jgi:hypothetical protein
MKGIRDDMLPFSLTPNPGGFMRYLTIIFCAVLVLVSLHQAQTATINVLSNSSTIPGGINGASSGKQVINFKITQPCDVECPPEGIPEQEPLCEDDWDDIWNAGCGGMPVAFEEINCNTKICGTSGTFLYYGAQYRDTDWFRVELTEMAIIIWSVVAEFPVLILLIDAGSENCEDYEILDWREEEPCDTATISMWVPAGVYWLWIGPWVFEGYPCGAEYVSEIRCSPCGDCNGDGAVDLADVVYMVNYLFLNGPAPQPSEAGDANCSGGVDLADAVYIVNWLFIGGPPPGCE